MSIAVAGALCPKFTDIILSVNRQNVNGYFPENTAFWSVFQKLPKEKTNPPRGMAKRQGLRQKFSIATSASQSASEWRMTKDE